MSTIKVSKFEPARPRESDNGFTSVLDRNTTEAPAANDHPMAPTKPGADLPLVVDLDGTLIYSDLLWESILLFLKKNFLQAWRLPLWLLQGKVAFKDKLAAAIEVDPTTLPYDEALLDEIRAQREHGRSSILATG